MKIKSNKQIDNPVYQAEKIIKPVGTGGQIFIPKEYIGLRAYVCVYNEYEQEDAHAREQQKENNKEV